MRKLVMTLALALASLNATAAAGLPTVQVFKSPYCGCCHKWVDHMKAAGFKVEVTDTTDLAAVRAKHGIADKVASCHTATVGGYAVEGHVPADDVKALLKAQPKARGIAVPGMPAGSPGMESGASQAYDTLLIDPAGGTKVFAHHEGS